MHHRKSYELHAEHFARHLTDGELRRLAETWLQDDTVDAWRHRRMYRAIDPFLEHFPGASWVTIGDGRWGRDAKYILDRGGSALPTDIADSLLREAKTRGYIDDYRVENAEALSFSDNAFDFVFCKESYHHFPRPALALYEMLRVARSGVVLIEPVDEFPPLPLSRLKMLAKRLTGRRIGPRYNWFEESGNYVYTVSERELEKVALGIGLPFVAFKPINMFYVRDAEYRKFAGALVPLLKLRGMIFLQDVLSTLALTRPGLVSAALLKEPPTETFATALRSARYRVMNLPRNPHL